MARRQELDRDRARYPRPTQVLYVMGAGRSGSTILGVALGNCSGLFFAGELDKWLPRSGRPRRGGEERARFWAQVSERVEGAEPLFGGQAHRYLERSSALLRLRGPLVRRRLRGRYRRVMAQLYAAIAQASGASCVVETSHYPLRALELQSVEGIELHLILLVRQPGDVVASFARSDVTEPRFAPGKTRAYLLLTYLVSALVFLKQPRARRAVVFHEDFLEDPRGVLRQLLGQLDSQAELPDLGSLATGIALQGNRLLDEEVVSLKRRERPRDGKKPVLFDRLLLAGLSRFAPRVRP